MIALLLALVLPVLAEEADPPPLFPLPKQADLRAGAYPYAASLATGRIAIGLAPMVAYEPSMKLLGFPPAHDNASAKLMARLFGVRDIGLGVLVLHSTRAEAPLRRAFLFNMLTDLGDATMISIALLDDQGIDQAAGRILGFALGGFALWTAGYIWLRPR